MFYVDIPMRKTTEKKIKKLFHVSNCAERKVGRPLGWSDKFTADVGR